MAEKEWACIVCEPDVTNKRKAFCIPCCEKGYNNCKYEGCNKVFNKNEVDSTKFKLIHQPEVSRFLNVKEYCSNRCINLEVIEGEIFDLKSNVEIEKMILPSIDFPLNEDYIISKLDELERKKKFAEDKL